eukprot:6453130-Amphidinium_carterae.2
MQQLFVSRSRLEWINNAKYVLLIVMFLCCNCNTGNNCHSLCDVVDQQALDLRDFTGDWGDGSARAV